MKNPSYLATTLLPLCFFLINGKAQSYHALDGSPYAGVTSMYNNPASTVNMAFNWDVTVFSFQTSTANTAMVLTNNSVFNTSSSGVSLTQGLQSRYFYNNTDANLFNVRFKLNKKSAFSAGIRLRSYNFARLQPFYYSDTTSSIQSFFSQNGTVTNLGGNVTHAIWGELDLNYSQILMQSKTAMLTGGITLAYMKGLSGGFANVSNVEFTEAQKNDTSFTLISNAAVTGAYSANYQFAPGTTNGQDVKSFIKNALASAGVSIGAEYVLTYAEEEGRPVDATNYDWKFGLSIMDIGVNRFNPINGSFAANTIYPSVTDTSIKNQLQNISGIEAVRYKMLDFFKNVDTLTNRFNVSLPTRVLLYADKNLGSNFHINGQLNLNFFSNQQNAQLKTRELNLLTVTPRWETEAWGLYLPIQYNAQGMFWVGAAIKLGPLLVGVHSLDFYKWFKTGTQNYNGGGYILLSIHPFKHQEEPDAVPCPVP